MKPAPLAAEAGRAEVKHGAGVAGGVTAGSSYKATRPARRMRTCLFCQSSLGTNELIEHCPVGQRLAYDPHRGRLWVICGSCAGWNLTPLDERWDAIDECERLFERTAVGLSTENISMAVAFGRLELVRIGAARRSEMAIWRYARRLIDRRRRAYLDLASDNLARVIGSGSKGGMLGAGVALVTGGPLTVVGMGFVAAVCGSELWRELGPDRIESVWGRIVARVRIDRCDYSFVRTGHVPDIRLRRKRDHWSIVLPHSVGLEFYEGSPAVHVLGLMLPIANGFGASRFAVQHRR